MRTRPVIREYSSESPLPALCVDPSGFGGVIMVESPLASSGMGEFSLAEKVRIAPPTSSTASTLPRR